MLRFSGLSPSHFFTVTASALTALALACVTLTVPIAHAETPSSGGTIPGAARHAAIHRVVAHANSDHGAHIVRVATNEDAAKKRRTTGRARARRADQPSPKARAAAAESTARLNARATSVSARGKRIEVPAGPLPPTVMRGLALGHLPVSSISALVIRLDTDQRVLDYNTQRPMAPASTMKTLTTYAALSLLGANFRWTTSAFVDGPIQNGVLNGNLYIEGTGDPFLVPEQLTDLINQIRAAGITRINGDLVLDKNYFDPSTASADIIDDSTDAPYNVGPDALLYAFKSLTINVDPDVDGHAQVTITPPLSQLRVTNNIRPFRGPCRSTAAAQPHISNGPDGTLNVSFEGPLSLRCGPMQNNIAVMDHTRFFSGGFLALWQQAGGTFNGSIREATIPVAARRIAAHQSPPLTDIVKSMNKVSNNTMARNIYLTIGAVAYKPPATLEGADIAVKRWLRRSKIGDDGIVVDNGSGLARDARISTETMGEMLQSAFHSPVAQPLIDSLPTVGVDGTMRHRLVHSPIAGHAQIKTGTLSNVRAIAGYVFAANGHPYLVVSFINDPRSSLGGAAHDALLDWVYNLPG
ncbi:D-alanyl-D-alanine carboxypeptidase/D-alanyl-D-alanine endopeptidase [Robbsia andropogonis]|uniref:D-alanyl-D-alanine carboxypeptidase/D-alanyl-D-alanine endopeptidase n=1 Tax=Robbsia andropogonis TaxID=28092 RepID=UPI002A698DBC|nr:D-alanyl-D-alanine carboxypeptidase/D-alanyl-D-alanine-endopeptidase [Robbsia andropogonis]